MSDATYPRDLAGYAGRPPHPRWPGDARIAVSVVLNHEEGGEYSVLHGDAHGEYVLTDAGSGPPRQGARDLLVESMFDYGARAGFWRVARVLRERGWPTTVFAVGMALARTPDAAAEMREAGWEVACHGQRWIDYASVPEEIERADIAACTDIVTRMIGVRPVGWYTGRPSVDTRRLVAEHGGFLYDSDAYDDDLPHWRRVDGRTHLVVPYTLDVNDARLVRGGDFASAGAWFEYARDAFEALLAEGSTAPKLLSIGLHSRLIGRPGRIGGLIRLLDHIASRPGVWRATRADIARHWIATHPA